MYKLEMAGRYYFIIPFVLIVSFLFSPLLSAETAVRDSTTLSIAHDIWHNQFPDAIKKAENIIENESNNPLGYFLLGTIYQTISEEFRTDLFKEKITDYLDKAIKLSDDRKNAEPGNADWPFICGAAFGYRALHRAFRGGWWGAFQDGLRCSSNLNKALELDSTYYDAYLGLGAYHYYKTVKAKNFLWLPFVSDRRQQGIEELRRAVKNGLLATHNARQSLMKIFYEEGRYEELLSLADSLNEITPDDPYCLLYHARGLTELDSLEEAGIKLRKLSRAWKKSPYFDPLGLYEAELIRADIFRRYGDIESAQKIINKIISEKRGSKNNGYFAETLDRAERLSREIK